MLEKRVNLFGTEYLIKYLDKVEVEDNSTYTDGLCDSANRVISVALRQPNGALISSSDLNKNTWHELTHAILDEGQYLEQSNNEALVEWLARCVSSILNQDVFCENQQSCQSHTLPDQQLEINFVSQEGE